MYARLRHLLGIVRLRQLADQIRHRLSFIPGLYVLGAFVIVQVTLVIDRALSGQEVPQYFATTVDSARSVFGAIAGGLITSITLLLSMMLITVQLASSQFSPRTLRDWLGDAYLKHTVGLALGTTVFSLVALRSTRSFGEEGGEIVPHVSVILAVVLGVVSLFGVVQSVDHVTQSLQIGSVARRIAADTIRIVESSDEMGPGQAPARTPSSGDPGSVDGRDSVAGGPSDDEGSSADDDPSGPDRAFDHVDEGGRIPDDAAAIETPAAGWVQQIRPASIIERLPEGATGYIVAPLGAFVPSGTPLMWVSPAPPEDHECRAELLNGFALGDTRTMQQDVGFGLVQLTDIAVRALSPGVNDPSTANDLVVHLGDVMLAIWSKPVADHREEHDGRSLVRLHPQHEEYLRRAFDPIRRYGASDPTVMLTMVRTLRMLVSEIERRSLPGPSAPVRRMIEDTINGADTDSWAPFETRQLQSLARRS
ncbi:MAG: DUF2254 domain-containing protein [Ilumatobacter sp.]